MPVPFLDTREDFRRHRAAWLEALQKIGESGRFILGPHLRSFERDCARFLKAREAVGLANGTDALILALRAASVGKGDEVITTPFSFFATAGAICRVGAKPVFADIDPQTFTLDPDAVKARIGKKTRALLPVHLYGAPANMTALTSLASKHRLPIIEDAAQSFGASWKGQYVGSYGDAAAFSFYPTKVLGGYGDGGLMTTRHASWAARVRSLANHGQRKKTFYHEELGGNSRLDEIQAALLGIKLACLKKDIAARRKVAKLYEERLRDLETITLPQEPKDGRHIYGLYTLRVPQRLRAKLCQSLAEKKIGFGIYYPRPLHLQTALSFLKHKKGDFPHAERAAQEVVSLPIFPSLGEEKIDSVCEAIRKVLR